MITNSFRTASEVLGLFFDCPVLDDKNWLFQIYVSCFEMATVSQKSKRTKVTFLGATSCYGYEDSSRDAAGLNEANYEYAT